MSTFINLPDNGAANYREPVASFATLPSVGNAIGDVRVTLDTASLYIWDGSVWQTATGGSGLSNLNGQTGSSQSFSAGTTGSDFNVSSSGNVHTFNIPNAGATARGVVSTSAQSFAGNKTFLNDVIIDGLLTLNGGVSGISEYKVEKITLSPAQITAKAVTLAETPTSATLTRLVPIGGVEQDYGTDFTVTGTTLSWSSLALDGVLVSGDELIIAYN
jgi:hypothetical protein